MGEEGMAAMGRMRAFLFGAQVAQSGGARPADLTHTAVTLLRTFPAVRDAALEYFAYLFHQAVGVFVDRNDYENDGGSGNQATEAVLIITQALCDLPAPWAQILAPWSIDLLKDIAATHKNCPTQVLQNCEAIRCLLNVVSVCLSRLDSNDRIDCIDSMLGSSQCDWVIGHVGRCDPSLVVPRALEMALQNSSPQNIDHVVTILAHLSPLHFSQIRQALLEMFEDSFKIESGDKERRGAIVPYLMQLASKSDIVLKALTKDINITSSTEVLDKLLRVCSMSIPGFGSGSTRLTLVILCLRAQAPVFLLLLNWAPKNVICRELLENLLQEMETNVRSSDAKIPLLESIAADITNIRRKLLHGSLLEKYAIARVTILISYQSPSIFVNTVSYLLQNSQDDKTLAVLVRIVSGALSMRATLESPDQSVDNTLSLVRQAHENALREAMNAETFPENFEEDTKIFKYTKDTCLERYCCNIATLLRWERSDRVVYLQNKPFTRVSEMNLLKLACSFYEQVSDVSYSHAVYRSAAADAKSENSMSICHSMATMLEMIDISSSQNTTVNVEILLKLTRANVKYFFRCLHEKDITKQFKGTHTTFKIFRRTCAGSKVARSVALREILETALFREAEIFGAKPKVSLDNNANFERGKDELLMFQNHKQGPITQLTQSHTSVFHAGIIGKGARKTNKNNSNGNTTHDSNFATLSKTSREIELLLGALMSCMEDNGTSLEAMTTVSLLLVELVSPDVMYNGLPWPDEDFTKVSIERELYIRQVFDGYPLVWHLIRMISCFRPALCYCSVLLRAVVATLIHQYGSKSDRYIGCDDYSLNEITVELLDIMCRGQLLPTPLNYISKMIPHLKPNEIVQILRDCVWNYTRDTVPSPELFTCDASGLHWRDPNMSKPLPQYTDTLRVLIQKNIATLGHLYPLMFLNTDASPNPNGSL